MSEHNADADAPEEISSEITGTLRAGTTIISKVSALEASFIAYRRSTDRRLDHEVPSKDALRAEVTGARAAIMASIEKDKPPSFWRIVAWLAGSGIVMLVAIGSIVWSASARISDMAAQTLILTQEVHNLEGVVGDLRDRFRVLEAKRP